MAIWTKYSQTMDTSNQYIKYRIKAVLNSQDKVANTSNVTISVQAWRTNAYSTYGSGTCYAGINSVPYSQAITSSQVISLNSYTELFSKTLNITHNSDGTKDLPLSAHINHSQFISSDQSWTVELDTIPRASGIAVTNSGFDIGSNLLMTIDPEDGSFTHRFYTDWYDGTWTRIYPTNTSGYNYSYPTPIDWCNDIPNSVTGNGRVKLETYSGSTKVGEKIVTFSAAIPTSVVPTVSQVITPVDQLGGYYVQSKSKVHGWITAGGAYSSTISGYYTRIWSGSTVLYSFFTAGYDSAEIWASGDIMIETIVTDSRGRTASDFQYFNVVAYAQPTITAFDAHRANSDGSANDQGEYIKVTGSSVISAINNVNDKLTSIRYRQSGTETWTWAVSNNTDYNANVSAVFAANVDYQYEIIMWTGDYYGGSNAQINVQSSFVLIDYHESGQSISFGKVAEEGRGLAEFEGDVYLNQKTRMESMGGVAMATDDHPFQMGPTGDRNIAGDRNGFQSRNNGEAAELHLNYYGGPVKANGSEIVAFETANNADVIKLYDGTMIQYTKKTVTYGSIAANANIDVSTQTGWTFNEAFLYTPAVTHTLSGAWSQALNIGLESVSTTGVGTSYLYNHHNATISSVNLTVHYMAIGRWK